MSVSAGYKRRHHRRLQAAATRVVGLVSSIIAVVSRNRVRQASSLLRMSCVWRQLRLCPQSVPCSGDGSTSGGLNRNAHLEVQLPVRGRRQPRWRLRRRGGSGLGGRDGDWSSDAPWERHKPSRLRQRPLHTGTRLQRARSGGCAAAAFRESAGVQVCVDCS